MVILHRLSKVLSLEDKGHLGSNGRIFSSNLKHDYLLFVSVASDIKIMNIRTAKYIGDIDGAHFKGTYNYGMIVNAGLQGKLQDMNNDYRGNYRDSRYMDMIVEQLNHYLMITCSVKDKMKVWKFDDGLSTPICQANAIGGHLDTSMTVMNTIDKDICIISLGNASNKAELFKLYSNDEQTRK
jgi:hypothetical protein